MKTLALIFGGEGHEREISALSAYTVAEKLGEHLRLIKIGISPSGDWYIYEGENEMIGSGEWLRDTERLSPTYPVRLEGKSGFWHGGDIIAADAAFPLLHGDLGEDGMIQGALKAAHIPYIGSSVAASAITADKAYTKIIAEHLLIPTVPWLAPTGSDARGIKREAESRLGYPMLIKPRSLGSSIGVFKVDCAKDFLPAFRAAVSYGNVIIERLMHISYELELAHFNGSRHFISDAGIIETDGTIYGFGAKYNGEGSPKTRLGGAERGIVRSARRYARLLAEHLSLGNISRIDFFVNDTGELYFNEINSIPGATDSSLYPLLTEERLGMPFALDALLSGKLV